ncbi:MAG TPA: SGNH/GDSL hydrolase family protein, partial [Candidatus Limnocylindria bacterium]|nr:SGNH/GDSL hydrolase family protein [Candidatus Limnocylindria bacterium]
MSPLGPLKILGVLGIVVLVTFLVGLASLYIKVPQYQKYWQKRAAQPKPENALTYVALGDSTAQGIGATSPQKSYVGLIATALEQKQSRPVHAVNLSKSGARLQDCLRDQLPRLKELQADVVTIEIGANDMSAWDEASFRADMDKLMIELPKQAIISDIPYFGGGRYRHLEPNVEAANRIITDLAKRHGLRMAPLHQVTRDRDGVRTMAVDFFHPSDAGYKNWFTAFWRVL